MTILDLNEASAALRMIASFSASGLHIVAKTSHVTGTTLLASMKAARSVAKHTPFLPGSPDHGQQSVKHLQITAQGDLHAQDIDPSLVRHMSKELKARGLDFAIEKGRDGNTYIHFLGKDRDSFAHALPQAEKRLEQALAKKKTRADIRHAIADKVTRKTADVTRTSPDLTRQPAKPRISR